MPTPQPETSTDFAPIALAHAARGRRVFPWRAVTALGKSKPKKQPLVPWQDAATTDEPTIIGWAKRYPDARVGWTLPEGLAIVDVDDAQAAVGLNLPPAPEQRGTLTRSDGLHRLYRVSNGRQTQGELPGVDTRVGGLGWVALYSADAFTGEPPEAPAWFPRSRVNGHAATPFIEVRAWPARDAIAAGRLYIPAGKRDGTLASIAGTLISAGANAEATTLALQLINAAGAIEQPPGDEITDFDRIAESVARAAAQQNGSATPGDAIVTLAALSWADLMAAPSAPAPMLRPGVPTVGVTVIASFPKAGKTLWAGQVALESGRRTLIVVEEGSRDAVSYRLRRQAEALGLTDPPVSLMHRQRIRLDDRRSFAELRAHVVDTLPELIVLDPLNRLHGADENKPAAMTPVMDAAAELAYDHGGRAVLLIHHVNKPSAERRGDVWDRLRGASSIRSGTDSNLVLDGDSSRTYRKLLGELRDAEPLVEHLELDRDALLFRMTEQPEVPAEVDPTALRAFVEERGQVTSAVVQEKFTVSRNTAIAALRGLGCDEYQGTRGRLTFTLLASGQ